MGRTTKGEAGQVRINRELIVAYGIEALQTDTSLRDLIEAVLRGEKKPVAVVKPKNGK